MSDSQSMDYPIACTDQKSHRILVFAPTAPDWNMDESLIWSWSLLDVDGFSELLPAWGLPTEAKLRDSCGLAAIVPYPGGESLIWGACVGGKPSLGRAAPERESGCGGQYRRMGQDLCFFPRANRSSLCRASASWFAWSALGFSPKCIMGSRRS
ncbi:hypothetical protein PALA111701_19235 [Paenibacillus lactis]